MSTSPTSGGAPTVAATPATPTTAPRRPAPLPSALDGHVVAGRYRIESVLGTGGMAAVYRARDETLGRPVALKIIAPVADDPSAVKRERTEVELLASLNHPALVTLYDAGVDDIQGVERTYLVMELVDGSTLADRSASGPLGAADACRMAVDLAEALHVVHEHGVVHRDIKPGNILVSPCLLPGREITTKLADFGIAYLIDSTRLTVAGGLVGTAAYLSPEQAQGHPPAPASDIYSLGLVLLEALTGERSFPGTLMESVTARLLNDPSIPDTLAPAWRDLLARMTTRVPDARPTALDVALAARAIELDGTGDAGSAAAEPARGTAPQPTDATAVLPAVLPSSGGAAATPPPPAPRRAPSSPPRSRAQATHGWSRRRTLAVVFSALALLVAALVLVNITARGGDAPPTLPEVDEPLGTHLDDLLQSVTP
ncbi:serine/threonine-protein kinase [Sanguibacter sp. 25GB23B1]|uniref:serine/threonine-protein kinase n=1 Tax=unclassified Sanguibacter TaxID=2645534 RepID=UPI0032B0171F